MESDRSELLRHTDPIDYRDDDEDTNSFGSIERNKNSNSGYQSRSQYSTGRSGPPRGIFDDV